eukprot:m.97362 g.97362  ORF g.97362 m.97362 type:complete len:483 (-) comp26972_c0_seq2:207-1655(-)
MAGGSQCSLNDGVRTSGRIAGMCISVAMACAMVAMIQDDWIKFSSDDGFAEWPEIASNGTVSHYEFGLHSYCTFFTETHATELGIPDGKLCEDYGDYVSSYFTMVEDTDHCAKFEKAELCFYTHKIMVCLLIGFVLAFVGALYSEKPTATLVCGLGTMLSLGAAATMVQLLEANLKKEGGGDVEWLNSRSVCVAGTVFAMLSFVLGTAACYFKPDEKGSFRGYNLFNDNIELIGRVGSGFGQLGWLLFLAAALSNKWYLYEDFGSEQLIPYNLENTTDGYIGLLGFCVRSSQELSLGDSEKPYICYTLRKKFGDEQMQGCEIFECCDELNITMGILFCAIIVGALADFFSDKMMIQFGLQLVAGILGVATIIIMSTPLAKVDNIAGDGEIDQGIFFLIGGVVLFFTGAAFCFVDAMDFCRVKEGVEPNICQRCCSCGATGGGGSHHGRGGGRDRGNSIGIDHDGDGVTDMTVSYKNPGYSNA